MSDETTPGPDLRERLAAAIIDEAKRRTVPPAWPAGPGGSGATMHEIADAVMAVVQPEFDRRDAEITRLRALWAAVAKDSRNHKAEADGRRQHAEKLKAEIARLNGQVAGYENGLNWQTTCLGCAKLLDSCYAETMRAEQAEAERGQLKAAAARVKDLATNANRTGCGPGWDLNPADILATLDQGRDDLPAVREFAAGFDPRKGVGSE